MSGLNDIIERAIAEAVDSVRVAGLATVVKFTAGAVCNLVDIKPLVKKKLPTGEFEEDPVILNVPILYPASKTTEINFPLAVGDTVLYIACDRDIAGVKVAGATKPIEAGSQRKHALSDALAIPIRLGATALTLVPGSLNISTSLPLIVNAQAVNINNGLAGAARIGDTVSITLSPASVVLLATALLSTGAFTPALSPSPSGAFTDPAAGTITTGSATTVIG